MTKERTWPARPWYELVISEIALRGWAKTELSDRSGVARTTIDNWNTNRRKPSAKAVNAVADVLGIDRARAHVLAGIVAPDAGIPQEMVDAIDRMVEIGRIPAVDRDPFIEEIRRRLAGDPPAPPVSGQSGARRRAAG